MWQSLMADRVSSETWPTFAADVLLKVTVLLLMALIGSWLLRRRSAAARHFAWASAVGGSLIVPVLSLVLPGWGPVREVVLPAEIAAASELERRANGDLDSETTRELLAQLAAQTMNDRPAHGSEDSATDDASVVKLSNPIERPNSPQHDGWMTAASAFWLLGSALILLPLLAGFLRVEVVRWRAEKIRSPSWLELLSDVARGLRLLRPVSLTRSSLGLSPMTAGILRPYVLLPQSSDDWPTAKRRIVLLHELAHIKRWDVLTQWVAKLACAVFWMHPLVWLAARQMRVERERACDDLVLAAGEKPADYSQQLVEFAAQSVSPRWMASATLAMARPQELEDRLHRILDRDKDRRPFSKRSFLLCGLICFGLTAGVASAGRVVVRDADGNIIATVDIPDGGTATVENSPLKKTGQRPSSTRSRGSRELSQDEYDSLPAEVKAFEDAKALNPIDRLILERLRKAGIRLPKAGSPLSEDDLKELSQAGFLCDFFLKEQSGQSREQKGKEPEAGDHPHEFCRQFTQEEYYRAFDNWKKAQKWYRPGSTCTKCHDVHGLRKLNIRGPLQIDCLACHANIHQPPEQCPCPELPLQKQQFAWKPDDGKLRGQKKDAGDGQRIDENRTGGGARGELSDAEFLRQRTLDLTGLLPTVDETRRFLNDKSPDKRRKLTERLLASPESSWNAAYREFVEAQLGKGAYERWARQATRRSLAKELYSLLWIRIVHVQVDSDQSRDDRARQLAQFVINLVDALDPDMKASRFDYDPDLTDGWSSDPKELKTVYGVEPASKDGKKQNLPAEELLRMIDSVIGTPPDTSSEGQSEKESEPDTVLPPEPSD